MKPTVDSIYLGSRVEPPISPAGLQTLVTRYGDRAVEDALRQMHGFSPEDGFKKSFAYLRAMLEGNTP